MQPWIVATLVLVALLVAAEAAGSQAAKWVAKPLASTGFILTALAAGARETSWGRLVLAGLMLGWLGDVLLIPKGSRSAFLAGLGSFLLGHLAFAISFLQRGVSIAWLLPAAALMVGPALASWAWLRDRVPAEMSVPVRAYVSVISTMVACAFGTFGHAPNAAPLLGAVMFAVSDLAVARERFVAPGFANQLWGLPLYYGGQLLLAASTAFGISAA